MLLFISLLANIGFLLYAYFVWNFNHFRKRRIIGPEPQPLFGNFPCDVTQRANYLDEMGKVYDEYRESAPFIGVFRSRSPRILILDPSLVKNIMVNDFKSFYKNESFDMIDKNTDPIFSQNPFMLSGAEWKDRRGEITPGFTPARLKVMFPMIVEVGSGNLINYIKDKSALGAIDANDLAARFTTDVVANCIYGIDAKSLTGEYSEIRENASRLLDFNDWGLKIYFIIMTVFPFITKFWKRSLVPKTVEQFFIDLMKQATELRRKNKIDRVDFLEYIMQLQKKKNLTELDMAAHTVSFLMDGIETSSLAIASNLMHLAKLPEIQDKLRNDIKNLLKDDEAVTFEKLSELTYLDQVFCEAVRITPPFGLLSKECTETYPVNFNGKQINIEVGDTVELPMYSLHRDKRYWDNPNEFIPERFDAENGGEGKYRDQGVYFPFGNGPRMCLGMRFALAQSKVCILEIVRRFKISCSTKMEKEFVLEPGALPVKPRGGIWINFEQLPTESG